MTQDKKTERIATGTRTVVVACAVAVLSLGAVSSAVPMQPAGQGVNGMPTPPRPKAAEKPPVITSALLGAALSGVVIFAGLMPVKRSHQD